MPVGLLCALKLIGSDTCLGDIWESDWACLCQLMIQTVQADRLVLRAPVHQTLHSLERVLHALLNYKFQLELIRNSNK